MASNECGYPTTTTGEPCRHPVALGRVKCAAGHPVWMQVLEPFFKTAPSPTGVGAQFDLEDLAGDSGAGDLASSISTGELVADAAAGLSNGPRPTIERHVVSMTVSRDLHRELDDQGVGSDHPIRAVIWGWDNQQLAVARSGSRILGAAAYSLGGPRSDTVDILDLRSLEAGDDTSLDLLRQVATVARSRGRRMRVAGVPAEAIALYQRAGATFRVVPLHAGVDRFSSAGEWDDRAVAALAEGAPVHS